MKLIYYISWLFWSLAASCNAIMDTLAHHYYKSVFKSLDSKFWDASISWEFKSQFGPDFWSDGWHRFKTLTGLFIVLWAFCMSVYFHNKVSKRLLYLTAPIALILWVIIFNLMYNKILL